MCTQMKLCPMGWQCSLREQQTITNSSLRRELVKIVQGLPKQYRLSFLPLVVSQRLKVSPYCRRYHILKTQDMEKVELDLVRKPPWVLASIVPEGTMQRRGGIWSKWKSCPALMPKSHNKMSLKVYNSDIHYLVVSKSCQVDLRLTHQ